MFRDASSLLRGAGFDHYEVSSYARPGHRCAHNQAHTGGTSLVILWLRNFVIFVTL